MFHKTLEPPTDSIHFSSINIHQHATPPTNARSAKTTDTQNLSVQPSGYKYPRYHAEDSNGDAYGASGRISVFSHKPIYSRKLPNQLNIESKNLRPTVFNRK